VSFVDIIGWLAIVGVLSIAWQLWKLRRGIARGWAFCSRPFRRRRA
jgi:hypothetical protein